MDKFEQLKQYKELLDNGVISQEEFDSLKQSVLDAAETVSNAAPEGVSVSVETDKVNPNPAEGVTYINGVPQNPTGYYNANAGQQNYGAYQNGPNGTYQAGPNGAYQAGPQPQASSGMSAQATAILSYFGLVLWLVAYLAGDKVGAKFHLNQSLVLNLFAFLSIIPVLGWFWAIFILVCDIMGIVYAAQGVNKEVPLLGKIRILS